MMPLNQDTIIYYDFKGLEISSLPTLVPGNFNCNGCSITNVSNFPTTGTLFSAIQATVQEPQPVQEFKSTNIFQ